MVSTHCTVCGKDLPLITSPDPASAGAYGTGYVLHLFDLIKTTVTIEALKGMVNTTVTAIVMAIVTAIVIVAVRERIEGLHLC